MNKSSVMAGVVQSSVRKSVNSCCEMVGGQESWSRVEPSQFGAHSIEQHQ